MWLDLTTFLPIIFFIKNFSYTQKPRLFQMAAKFQGSLLGLAIGDAVGTTVECMPRGSFAPVQGLEGGGKFNLSPGQVMSYMLRVRRIALIRLVDGRHKHGVVFGRKLNRVSGIQPYRSSRKIRHMVPGKMDCIMNGIGSNIAGVSFVLHVVCRKAISLQLETVSILVKRHF